ncbi:MAG: DUF2061 domain-containing protein [Nanoarchaeota archaeon]
MKRSSDARKRSFVKALTYRVIIIVIDVVVVYALTRRLDIALWFTVVRNTFTIVAYYAHERAWNRIAWGRR